VRRRAGSGASRRSHHAHAWRWCACGSRSGGRGASSCLARSRVCLKNPVVRACWGRASGARAAGISAGGCQTRGAGKPCARLGEVCALEGPPLGAPWGGGDELRFAFTLVDAFAPKKRIHFGPQNLGETACKVFFMFQVQVQESSVLNKSLLYLGLIPVRAPSDVSHHLRRLSPPLHC
jgi:hypothetical protein